MPIEHISPTTEKPYPSWVWREVVDNFKIIGGYWDSPIPMPTDHGVIYQWNEEKLDWEAVKNV